MQITIYISIWRGSKLTISFFKEISILKNTCRTVLSVCTAPNTRLTGNFKEFVAAVNNQIKKLNCVKKQCRKFHTLREKLFEMFIKLLLMETVSLYCNIQRKYCHKKLAKNYSLGFILFFSQASILCPLLANMGFMLANIVLCLELFPPEKILYSKPYQKPCNEPYLYFTF